MRSRRNKTGKGLSVNEILEREFAADNNELNTDVDNMEDTSQESFSDKSDDYEENVDNESYEENSEYEFEEDLPEDEDYADDEELSENVPVKSVKSQNKYRNKKKNSKRKNGKIGTVVLIAACIFVVLCFAAYLVIAFGYYGNRFLQGTSLNGTDVSNVTADEFIDELSSRVESYTLTVMDNDAETDVINGTDIGLIVSDEGKNAIKGSCSSQNKIMWPMGFLGNKYELTVDNITAFDDDMLIPIVQSSKGYNLPQTIANESATLKFKEGKYEVTPPTKGNEIDKEAYMTRVREYIHELKDTMIIQDADVYVKAEGLIENEQALRSACDKANEIIRGASISIKMGGTNEDITADIMNGILSIDDNYNVAIDDNTINTYVSNLNKKYNNIGMTRTFKTGHGTEVQVKGGDYGCSINTGTLVADIKNAVFNKKPLNTTVKFTKNVLSGTGTEIGQTYIEVDLTNQYLYMYVDGKKVKECPVVTGLPGKRATPQGTYMLKNKLTDVPLVGDNYVTPVKYWMPFNGGIGLHDAVWQSRFGGELYKSKGSHGCVNLMMKDAADIYKNAVVRMPVVCYYHNRISSFQPVASSGPVQGTYRALTDKEKKMLSDLLNGKKVTDSSAVRDSNEGQSVPVNNNTDASQVTDQPAEDGSEAENTANENEASEAPQTSNDSSANTTPQQDNVSPEVSDTDNNIAADNTNIPNASEAVSPDMGSEPVNNSSSAVDNTGVDNAEPVESSDSGGEVIEEIVVSPE